MSEQGWRELLAADGIDDWVVLHRRGRSRRPGECGALDARRSGREPGLHHRLARWRHQGAFRPSLSRLYRRGRSAPPPRRPILSV